MADVHLSCQYQSILGMNASTVAELKSYQKPPYPVHEIMIATLMIVGVKEKDLKKYENVKIALNKTGKEGELFTFLVACTLCRSVRRTVTSIFDRRFRGFDICRDLLLPLPNCTRQR